MSYVFDKSAPSTGAVAMYNFKACAKTAGWSVPSSGDGLSSYSSSSDTITGSSSGANGLANSSAWFRIRDPAGVREITVQRNSNLNWRIKYSASARFTGGSPSATQTPSATDEVILLGGGTDASPTYAALLTADAGYTWKVGFDNASPYGFWSGGIINGGASLGGAFWMDPVNGDASDTDPVVFYIPGGAWNSASYYGLSGPKGWLSNTHTSSGNFVVLSAAVYYDSGNAANLFPAGLVTNPFSGKQDGIPPFYARRAAATAPQGVKGVSRMLKWIGTSKSNGETLTVVSSQDYIIMSGLAFPWDGTTPSV
jgi:hypothetical protein